MYNPLKVSMITATFNDAEHLKMTLESNLSQSYKNYECIVIDGGSKDNTVEVLKEYETKFKGKLKWVSESDNGIFDAINKGYLKSTGDIIGIQFDLWYNENSLENIADTIYKSNCDGVHGDLVYIENNKIVRKWKNGDGDIKKGWSAAHPTLYLKRSVYDKYGLYKTNYKCAADYEFEVRIFKENTLNIVYIPEILVKMFYGGTSTGGLKAYLQSLREGHRALKENNVRNPYCIDFLRCVKVIKQFIIK